MSPAKLRNARLIHKNKLFLHTGNEHSENEIKKTNLFMITLNNKTRYNFNKKSQDLYIENYKAL